MKELNQHIINEFECIKKKNRQKQSKLRLNNRTGFYLKHDNASDEILKELTELITLFDDDDLKYMLHLIILQLYYTLKYIFPLFFVINFLITCTDSF